MRIRVQNRCYRIFSLLWRYGSSWQLLRWPVRNPRQNCHPAALARVLLDRHQGASLSQSKFLNRQSLYLRPDPARVVVRPFKPATEPRDLNPTDKIRANHIVDRVLRLDAEATAQQLSEVLENFEGRHRNLLDIFEARAAEMEDALEPHAELNKTQRGLIGAYFLNEYSFEASALFNPSIVRHPDQTGAPENGCRFILSLRAVGEGHISSLTFRSGTIAADGSVSVDPTARLASVPKIRSRTATPNGDDVEVSIPTRRGTERTGYLSDHRLPIKRHRGCAVRRIQRQWTENVLCDLHGL